MKSSRTIASTIGILIICLTAGPLVGVAQRVTRSGALDNGPGPALTRSVRQDDDSPCKRFPRDQVFNSLALALKSPDKAKCLSLEASPESGLTDARHLPPGLGRLTGLEVLSMACLEHLVDLPAEIGSLARLQELIIDNGNGCAMNVTVPASIGKLQHLRVLRLYGALDGRDIDHPKRAYTPKVLPDAIGDLHALEVLDLGRNGLRTVPRQIARLTKLKELHLDYSELRQLPDIFAGLKDLKEITLDSNRLTDLPPSLARIDGLKISLGDNSLKLVDQKRLRARFPHAIFSFEGEFDDASTNETPKTKAGHN